MMEINTGSNSLQEMYSDNGFLNSLQREKFCQKTLSILGHGLSVEEDLNKCLLSIWKRYDMGGHSYGRSARSVLLESTRDFLLKNEAPRAKECLKILLAMYHDIDYINRTKWMDFSVTSPMDAGMEDLFMLVISGFMLDIDELPDMMNISQKDIRHACDVS